ncbi:Sua5/YciO/YrdC/YwlC family protein [Kitasatospora sp. NPDC096147]|uniref:Sua5/YciO/YrdC/YwlC family protein n=1 Tax=Kitasatospora sp. NPDC096147 TaxID=3364093 RepID=UPI0037F94C3C
MTTPQASGTLGAVGAALHRGTAVVLPNPAPLTHVVAGTDPLAVNSAKGRPADQPVALWAHHPATLTTLTGPLPLGPGVRRLLTEERVTLLLPLLADAPPWLAPATRDGWTMLFGARWAPVLPLLDPHPVLYVSSANRTGSPPAATTAEAHAMFPPEVPVLALPDASPTPRAATTTLRLHPNGRLDLHRPGAQDRRFPSPGAYLDHVRTTYLGGPAV